MSDNVKRQTSIYCSLQVEGTHNWPDCPIEEVDYLKVPHRHIFHIKAYKPVNHDDRDVEFIWFKHEIEEYFYKHYFDEKKRLCVFGAMSCEMIANELMTQFKLSKCEVSEDDENGAIVEWSDS